MYSENKSDKYFVPNLLRLQDGTFSVRLLLIDSSDWWLTLGDSHPSARMSFLNFEKRFERQPNLLYTYFTQEYIDLAHMSEANIPKPNIVILSRTILCWKTSLS